MIKQGRAAILLGLLLLSAAHAAAPLTSVQLQTLVVTGKVWGFLKYHHPAVTAGGRNWDQELLDHLPALLAARSSSAMQRQLAEWVDSLGPVAPCAPCVQLAPGDLQTRPRLGWLADRTLLGPKLSGQLRAIYQNRVAGQQAYVRLAEAGNADFETDAAFAQAEYPNRAYQVLGTLRYWNIIEYWFPYRDLIDEDWDAVLRDALPRLADAPDAVTYQRELMALIARSDDGHATLGSSMRLREPVGDCHLPVTLRYLDGQFVVDGFLADEAARSFHPGDVITSFGDEPLTALVARVGRYYGASNETTRQNNLGRALTRGDCGPVSVGVTYGVPLQLDAQRLPVGALNFDPMTRKDRPGDTFQMLAPDVAYLKLSSIKVADVPRYLQRAASASSLIVDLRNYPSAFVVFALGSLLVDQPTPFATFTFGDFSNPGAFHWGNTLTLTPAQPHFGGKVAILVDNVTISSAEYHAMALRASPRAILVGGQTAGADGNVSNIPLPGGLRAAMSGLGVFYPDRRPTQRRGLDIDVPCAPTIAGLRAGRDEILECAERALAAR
jgi:hypothetical protein